MANFFAVSTNPFESASNTPDTNPPINSPSAFPIPAIILAAVSNILSNSPLPMNVSRISPSSPIANINKVRIGSNGVIKATDKSNAAIPIIAPTI